MVFAFEKFNSYLLGTRVIVNTDYYPLRYLMSRNDAKQWFIILVLLLLEFYFEVYYRKQTENEVINK